MLNCTSTKNSKQGAMCNNKEFMYVNIAVSSLATIGFLLIILFITVFHCTISSGFNEVGSQQTSNYQYLHHHHYYHQHINRIRPNNSSISYSTQIANPPSYNSLTANNGEMLNAVAPMSLMFDSTHPDLAVANPVF